MTIDATQTPANPAFVLQKGATAKFSLRAPTGHAVMILLSLVCLFPVYWMILSSLRPANTLLDGGVWPTGLSLENYAYALKAIPIGRMLLNTVVISVVVTAFQLMTGLLAAYAFACYRFPFSRAVYSLMAMTWLIPLQVVMIPNYLLVARLGLLDSLTALILPHVASALSVMLLTQSMRAFPKEVLEAARMDGAGVAHAVGHHRAQPARHDRQPDDPDLHLHLERIFLAAALVANAREQRRADRHPDVHDR